MLKLNVKLLIKLLKILKIVLGAFVAKVDRDRRPWWSWMAILRLLFNFHYYEPRFSDYACTAAGRYIVETLTNKANIII